MRINSFQSLGTVDGPGLRAVVFLQGCPLRCHCCHNPDSWDYFGGEEISEEVLLDKIIRLKGYIAKKGGVTFSGGEPLLQTDSLLSFIHKLSEEGLHVAIDTSGCFLNDKIKELLNIVDLVLLDYKYTSEEEYQKYVGCKKSDVDSFLEYLYKINKPTIIRQVIVPSVNDNEESIKKLFKLKEKYLNIEKIELLPFRKLCKEKYDNMSLHFPFGNIREATSYDIERCLNFIK